jgi:3-methyl-2-oxobutanoate hydroxymethyltransferase
MYDGPTPRFVKQYADLAGTIGEAVARYAADVRSGAFPGGEHAYRITPEELSAFESALPPRR